MLDDSPPPLRPRRRAVLGGLLGSALALTGCGSLGSKPRVREWNLFGGGDGARLLQVSISSTSNPNTPTCGSRATDPRRGAPPYYTKLAMSAAGGRAPDVATLHMSRMKGYSPGRAARPASRSTCCPRPASPPSDFPPETWERSSAAAVRDSVGPTRSSSTTTSRSAGRRVCSGRTTDRTVKGVTEFLDMLRAVKETTGKYAVSVDTTSPWRLWWTLYGQLEGEFFSPDGKELVIDDAKALEALDLIAKLASEGLTPRSANYAALVAQFSNGEAGLTSTVSGRSRRTRPRSCRSAWRRSRSCTKTEVPGRLAHLRAAAPGPPNADERRRRSSHRLDAEAQRRVGGRTATSRHTARW